MQTEKTFQQKLLTIFGVTFITVLWLFLFQKVLFPILGSWNEMDGSFEETKIGAFFFTVILAPLWEELAWRHAPILIARQFKKHLNLDVLWPIVIISSIHFGWGHGHGPISLLMQGVGGFALSYVYIKNGYSYWSSVAAHALWNLTVAFLLPAMCS